MGSGVSNMAAQVAASQARTGNQSSKGGADSAPKQQTIGYQFNPATTAFQQPTNYMTSPYQVNSQSGQLGMAYAQPMPRQQPGMAYAQPMPRQQPMQNTYTPQQYRGGKGFSDIVSQLGATRPLGNAESPEPVRDFGVMPGNPLSVRNRQQPAYGGQGGQSPFGRQMPIQQSPFGRQMPMQQSPFGRQMPMQQPAYGGKGGQMQPQPASRSGKGGGSPAMSGGLGAMLNSRMF